MTQLCALFHNCLSISQSPLQRDRSLSDVEVDGASAMMPKALPDRKLRGTLNSIKVSALKTLKRKLKKKLGATVSNSASS